MPRPSGTLGSIHRLVILEDAAGSSSSLSISSAISISITISISISNSISGCSRMWLCGCVVVRL